MAATLQVGSEQQRSQRSENTIAWGNSEGGIVFNDTMSNDALAAASGAGLSLDTKVGVTMKGRTATITLDGKPLPTTQTKRGDEPADVARHEGVSIFVNHGDGRIRIVATKSKDYGPRLSLAEIAKARGMKVA